MTSTKALDTTPGSHSGKQAQHPDGEFFDSITNHEGVEHHVSQKFNKEKFLTLAELEERSPTRKDGVSELKEALWRRAYCALIQEIGIKFKVPMWAITTGMFFCHKFFSRKSMKRNEIMTVATACIFLSCKVAESPRPLRQIVEESLRYQYGNRDSEATNKRVREELDEMREQVLLAERAVLYTIGFELQVDPPYKHLIDELKKLKLIDLPANDPHTSLVQTAWNFLNDSHRTLLCLQFPPDKIAKTTLYMAYHILGMNFPEKIKGPAFYREMKISEAELTSIGDQIVKLYETVRLESQRRQSPLPAASPPSALKIESSPGPSQPQQQQQQQVKSENAGSKPGTPRAALPKGETSSVRSETTPLHTVKTEPTPTFPNPSPTFPNPSPTFPKPSPAGVSPSAGASLDIPSQVVMGGESPARQKRSRSPPTETDGLPYKSPRLEAPS